MNIAEFTAKVDFEATPTSKALIRGIVAEVLQEALLDDSQRIPFDSKDAVREFIRVEVRTCLAEEIRHMRALMGSLVQ
jgi:hypothetical protein